MKLYPCGDHTPYGGYSYEKAPVQDKFLKRKQTKELFKKVLAPTKRQKWVFNHSPFYLDFLKGERDYECTPWGNPNYTLFGCFSPSRGRRMPGTSECSSAPSGRRNTNPPDYRRWRDGRPRESFAIRACP
ncbi:DUF3463 domain-containing protein [Salmonella enterica]|uniref:DUF3463 domain-containing protein n=1 Tax=Salmonella enterica subsp. enterica serovar Dessau TaxID=2564349 RepID=A0A8E5IN53_SALET|nr:DUF3463 domain-containing protein [Salmonella enterica subsp. enterica serovar Dessau]